MLSLEDFLLAEEQSAFPIALPLHNVKRIPLQCFNGRWLWFREEAVLAHRLLAHIALASPVTQEGYPFGRTEHPIPRRVSAVSMPIPSSGSTEDKLAWKTGESQQASLSSSWLSSLGPVQALCGQGTYPLQE